MAPFNMNYFCAYMAIMLANVAVLKKYFDELYQTDRFRFYKRAKESPLYDSELMYGGKLETEVARKRIMGIFLSTQDDENLRDRIRDKIIDYYPPVKKVGVNFSLNLFNTLREKFENSSDVKKSQATMTNVFFYFASYIVLCYYGFDTDNKGVRDLYENIRVDIFRRSKSTFARTIQDIDDIHPKEYIIVPREQRKFYETIQSGNDLMDLIDLYDSLIGYGPLINRTQSGIHKGRLLASFLDPDYLDVFTMLTLMRLFDTELAVHQLSIIDFLDETPITKEDKDRALKIVADNFKRIDFEEFRTCTLTAYIMTLLFGVIAKGISDNKNFYFENNNETQYNELEWIIASNDELQAKVKQLQSDLSYQEEYVRILKSQIKDLESNASKNVQGTVQDLNKEIMLLESKINALQDELLVERRKNIELNRLREFVFSIQAGDDIAIPKEKLKDLAGSKKIYIFGGHINWRNKMKRQYPFLTILDGHRESFDERILFNADLVLLNTSNMSHALYYKVIDILRTNDISFDYIGKYKNTDLLEGEIAEILLRRKE